MKAQQKYHDFDLSDFPYDTEAANTYYVYWAKFKERGEELFSDATHTHSYTPQHLVRRILREIDFTGTLLALNPEFAFELVYINKKDPSEITLWCPTQNHERMAKGLQCNVIRDLFDRTKLTMQFDVVLMNPPYNDTSTLREETKFRGQGVNLARKFVELGIALSKVSFVAIFPYGSKNYSAAAAKKYAREGLNRIENVSEFFVGVKQIIGAFYFNRAQSVKMENIVDEFLAYPIPTPNLTEVYVSMPGSLYRKDFEHLLKETGAQRVIVTTNIVRYTDDPTFPQYLIDRTRGKWRVVMNVNGNPGTLGKLLVAEPTDILSSNVNCLVFDTQAEAEKCLLYLELDSTREFIAQAKLGSGNNKRILQFLPL